LVLSTFIEVVAALACVWVFAETILKKGCQELPQIHVDCSHFCALGKRQALAMALARFVSCGDEIIMPLSPMATLLSAQMAQRSKKVLGTGHG
jgi:hypothetical protein